ncbi:MAG: hypothetical protein ACMUJM_05395 [bacterium]
MVEISLTRQEAGELQEILESDLSDLRMEIADTDKMDFRENLKRREEFLKRLILLLQQKSE